MTVPGRVEAPIIAIVGTTASGKSQLAMHLAQHFDADILCADASTIYRKMDIGTAKPSAADRAAVRHYGLDLAEPDEPYSAADYQAYALDVLAKQAARGRRTIVVGGSGLYIDSVLMDYDFTPRTNQISSDDYGKRTVAELQQLVLDDFGPEHGLNASDWQNSRRLIGYLRRGGVSATSRQMRPGICILGVQVERDVLAARISSRVDHMLAGGLRAEALALAIQYGWGAPGLWAIGYQEFRRNEGAGDEAIATEITLHTRQLAKRQRAWFARNPSVQWVSTTEDAVDLVTTYLYD